MSRFGDEDADHLDDDTNAVCADCGTRWYKSEFDVSVWCAACVQRREDWAAAQEVKAVAKAVLDVDLTKIKDIA